jgi:OOP family OmpA-OmpF porin
MSGSKTLVGVSGLVMLVALSAPGCATKKYVLQQTTPIQQRVEDVDKKHSEALASLESKEQKDVSRVEERAMTAENKANDAARAAQQADQKATQAGQAAQNATQMAQVAQSKIGDLSTAFQNMDSFKVATKEDVLFRLNSAVLTDDAKAQLDKIAQQVGSMPRYVVEVEGFTDRSGSSDYNLALSRRRADAVARYLVDHNVPLRRVHLIGLGEGGAAAAEMQNTSAEQPKMTNKERRRVVVKLYVPDSTMSASSQQQ